MGADDVLEEDIYNGEPGHAAKHNAVNAQVNYLTEAVAALGPGARPYPLELTTTAPNLFAGAPLPAAHTGGGMQQIARNLDAEGPRVLRVTWSHYLAGGSGSGDATIFVREYGGAGGTGTELVTHEIFSTNKTKAYAGHPDIDIFEFDLNASTVSVALMYVSTATAITFTEFDARQVEERSDLIVLTAAPKVTGVPDNSWRIDQPIANADGTTPARWRGRTVWAPQGHDFVMEMSHGGSLFFEDDDTYASSGHLGYQAVKSDSILGTTYDMDLGNNDFIISPRSDTDDFWSPLFDGPDGLKYVLRGNTHGGEHGRTGDVNVDFELWADRLGDGNWRRILGPELTFRCRAVKVVEHTTLDTAEVSSFADVDKTYYFYPDGTYRQDRRFVFNEDTQYCDWFFYMSSYNPAVPLKGRIGTGSETLGDVDYAGGDADGVVDDLAVVVPGQWGVYLHPGPNLCQGQAIDSAALLRKSAVTRVQTRAIRYGDGGGAKFYQRVYCTPDGEVPFDSDPANPGTGSNFVPAGTVFNTRQWGFMYQPADLTYFEREMYAKGGRIPTISTVYPGDDIVAPPAESGVVTSVNGLTGDVTLTAAAVGALAADSSRRRRAAPRPRRHQSPASIRPSRGERPGRRGLRRDRPGLRRGLRRTSSTTGGRHTTSRRNPGSSTPSTSQPPPWPASSPTTSTTPSATEKGIAAP
jgi:hypothetical protein